VRAEGWGILNVQLANTYGYRDHYIPLDFTLVYFELDPPEDRRFYEYGWPYNFVDLMYWPSATTKSRPEPLLQQPAAGVEVAC